ncbi:hypothetical protein JCM17961_20910 [Endothiovibrio diazotrophicus]
MSSALPVMAEEPSATSESVSDERLDPGQTVKDRAHPEYAALGIRAGSFLLYPQAKLEARYDDNIYFSNVNRADDWTAVVTPSLQIDSDWGRHALTIDMGAEINRYDEHTREDGETLWLNATGRIDISQHTVATVHGELGSGSESRGSPDDAAGLKRAKTRNRAVEIGVEHRPGRFFVIGKLRLEALDFGDVTTSLGTVINNDDRDRNEQTASVTGGYQMFEGFDAFVRYSRGTREYDAAVDDGGFKRDSSSDLVEVGADLNLSSVLIGEVALGSLSFDYDDPAFRDIDEGTANALLYWHVTPLTTFTFQVARSVSETTTAGSSGYTSDVLAVSVYHELLRNLVLQSSLSSVTNDYNGIAREDELTTFRLSAEYEANRNLFFGAGYENGGRDSNAPGIDYDREVISAWVGLRL